MGMVRDPQNHRSGAHESKQTFCEKFKNKTTFKRLSTISWYFTQTLQNCSDSFSKVPSNFAVLTLFWICCLSTSGEVPRPPKSCFSLFSATDFFQKMFVWTHEPPIGDFVGRGPSHTYLSKKRKTASQPQNYWGLY